MIDVPVAPVVWVSHRESLLRAALDGSGITSTGLQIAATHLQKGELVRVLSPWIVGRPSIYAALAQPQVHAAAGDGLPRPHDRPQQQMLATMQATGHAAYRPAGLSAP